MKVRTARGGGIALAAAGMLLLSSCSAAQAEAPGAIEPTGDSAKGAECEAVEVGAFTRCENFYEDFWPEIDRQMDALYEQAKETDDGRLVIWDWYELAPEVIAQFNSRYPDLTIETRGLTYNLPSAVISAEATGSRNTDILSGSLVSAAAMTDEGYWAEVDWTEFGVPEEFLTIGAPEMLPDSVNGSLMQVNTDKIEAPESLDGLLAPEYEGKVSIASYNPIVFSGYGMSEGEEAMVELIGELKSSGTMQILEDQNSPLSSGDVPIALNQTLFNPNPSLAVQPFEHSAVFAQFSGVNADAGNMPGAMLWALWNAYDPDWIELRMTDEQFSTTQVPYPGLPSSVFEQATGLMKTNADALLQSLDNGAQIETQDTRDEWIALTNAADAALNG
ncbi:ABC transporter substrate-binding protein [Agromyces italicus]|uniref:ABC transporter substrate-binding protein n=1 Tax=Agromyces italicus TaxID=279572 RepID=UPI0003B56A88|nr:ABC transporter substrate-binding protein [Agromyces italicus]